MIRTHDLTRVTRNLSHYTTKDYISDCLKYLLFNHQIIKIFCPKNRKTRDFEKQNSIRNMSEIALTP